MRNCTRIPIGFISPLKLVFGHVIQDPLKLLKKSWITEEPYPLTNLLDQVFMLCGRLTVAYELAYKNMKSAQAI